MPTALHATPQVIVERMMGYLRTSIDEHIRRDISRKVRWACCAALCCAMPRRLAYPAALPVLRIRIAPPG